MPNKEQLILIVKSTRYLLEFILNEVNKGDNSNNIESDIQMIDSTNAINSQSYNKLGESNNSFYLEKALFISNKILKIYINLSRNFYGQSIILHSEFDINGIVSPLNFKSNPSLNFTYLQNYLINKLKNLDSNINNNLSVNFLDVTHNYLMIILLNFYDCLYFEYASNYLDGTNNNLSNTLLSNNIFTADFLNDQSKIKCVVSDSHIVSLISSISGLEISKENLFEISKNIQEMFISLNDTLENISNKYYQLNNDLFNQNYEINYNDKINIEVMTENIANVEEENYPLVKSNQQNNFEEKTIGNNENLEDIDQNQENSDNLNMDINNIEANKELNSQKDEMTNLMDTEMNTNNLNNSTNNMNTPNNNFLEVNQKNSTNGLENIFTSQKKIHTIQNILEKLNLIKRNNSLIIRLLTVNQTNNSFVFLEIINSETLNKPIKLPNTRKIYEKCEMINKYYDFVQTQSIDYNLPIPTQIIQNQSQSQIINPLLNNLNNQNTIGNSSPTNASTAPSNIFSNPNALGASLNSAQNLSNPHNSLMNKLNELGFARQNIIEFEKLLNWKKYRIYLAKMDNLLIRKDLFDLDTCLKIFPENQLLKQLNNVDFSLLVNTNFMNKLLTYVNLDSFQQFCNMLSNENLLVERYSNISYSVNKNFLNKKLVLTDSIELEDQEVCDMWIKGNSGLSCYRYEFEFYKLASSKNVNLNMAKLGSGIKTIGILSLAKNNTSKSN